MVYGGLIFNHRWSCTEDNGPIGIIPLSQTVQHRTAVSQGLALCHWGIVYTSIFPQVLHLCTSTNASSSKSGSSRVAPPPEFKPLCHLALVVHSVQGTERIDFKISSQSRQNREQNSHMFQGNNRRLDRYKPNTETNPYVTESMWTGIFCLLLSSGILVFIWFK